MGKNYLHYLGEGNGAEDEEFLKIFTAIFCPLTYRGYNYDFTTGLYYLQSRYYNPDWGRFLNVDDTSILLATQGETHGANLFAYCENNPVNKVDYTGYECEELIYNILYYVLFPLALIDQKLRDLDLAYVLEQSTVNFRLIYETPGFLTYRFQFITYSYSSQYFYYQESFDFDFYYAKYDTWKYYLENYNNKGIKTWILKKGVTAGTKKVLGSLVPTALVSTAMSITIRPVAQYVKQNDKFVKNSIKYLKKFEKSHPNYEDVMFFAFSSIIWFSSNYSTGETQMYKAYKGDKRIEALI